ncbi:HIT domain-containing protein [Neptunicella sp. SCSIO 80796]|uniref:HIT domain-containing protein n=1 Tax=Neptunicella plasticusilytica TaxID=3117012 RepID=UPI003A4DC0C3
MFTLAPQLAQDTFEVMDLDLCKLLLMNDCQYPWLILVPMRNDIREIIQLDQQDQLQLWQESALISRGLQQLFKPDKLNIAALGNMVPQLHLHHIARFEQDIAWPKPVWGQVAPCAYQPAQRDERLALIRQFIHQG